MLLELLESPNSRHQRAASVALYKLADKALSLSPVDAGPPTPICQVCLEFFFFYFFYNVVMNKNVSVFIVLEVLLRIFALPLCGKAIAEVVDCSFN